MEGFLYFVLLLIAVAAGYLVGVSRSAPSWLLTLNNALHKYLPWVFSFRSKSQSPYLAGLAQVINNEPDAAVESFTDSFEVNKQTLGTHLAVGDLLRRRGEVHHAIYVHQNILNSMFLDTQQVSLARMALALDYQQAGLLDRAEALFKELALSPITEVRRNSVRALATIYEQEQEWLLAIEMLEKLHRGADDTELNSLLNLQAHYCCELAEDGLGGPVFTAQGLDDSDLGSEGYDSCISESVDCPASAKLSDKQLSGAKLWVDKAVGFCPGHSRARILAAMLAVRAEQWRSALNWLMPLGQFSPGAYVVTTVVPLLRLIYQKLDRAPLFDEALISLYAARPLPALVPLVAEIVSKQQTVGGALYPAALAEAAAIGAEGEVLKPSQAAARFLCSELRPVPSLRPFSEIVRLHSSGNYSLQAAIAVAAAATTGPAICKNCGFESQQHYWRCPTCKSWC